MRNPPKTILDQDYTRQFVNAGAALINNGLFPPLDGSDKFGEDLRAKIHRNVQHLFDHREETIDNHPFHHLYIGEVNLKLGYAIYGFFVTDDFRDEIGFYRVVFSEYIIQHPEAYRKFLAFKKKGNIDEKIRVLQTHDPKGLLRIRKFDTRMMRKGLEWLDIYEAKPNKDEREKYQQVKPYRADLHELCALFKGAVNTKH
jgi:hypothetical protein